MSSFQGVGIEGFHCYTEVSISGCGNRGVPLLYRGVLISGGWNRGSTVYRGVLISGCWNRGVLVSLFQGVGIEGFHCIQRCSHFRVWE